METRRLGKTEHQSSVLIFGGAALWDEDQETANEAIALVRSHGVNHFDVAPQYGKAEELVGPWLADHRDEVFLGCKTLERGREGAWAELHRSLEKLHTDHIDLYQLHAVGSMEELDAVLAPGGALEAFVRARDEGLVDYLGITGHGYEAATVHAEALRRFDFDTVMTPLNYVQWADKDWRANFEGLLEEIDARDVGLMIIKTVSRGPWHSDGDHAYNTWYRPFDTPERIAEAVRFVLSFPQVSGLTHAGDLRLLPMTLAACENFELMSEAEREALVGRASDYERLFVPGS